MSSSARSSWPLREHGRASAGNFRTDPQIAEVYGRADHVMVANPARLARLAAAGDYFGVHMHPIRWCPKHRAWVHDFDDAVWHGRVVRAALEACAACVGKPARRFRGGAGFLTNGIVETLEAAGVEVDLTLEAIVNWGLAAVHLPTSIDDSPIVGRYPDCRTAPHQPSDPPISTPEFRGATAGVASSWCR